MNIHPIIVHFPIAFLTLYSFITILPLTRRFPNISWKQIEAFLLFLGVLGLLPAMITGNIAVFNRGESQISEMHSTFAFLSLCAYALCIVPIITPHIGQNTAVGKIIGALYKITSSPVLKTALPIIGFIFLFLTGLLGGVMVYGTSADPFAPFVLKLLGIN